MNSSESNRFPDYSRRHFLKTSALALAGGISSNLVVGQTNTQQAAARQPFTPNGDTLKIGLIGCGGRGTGAAANALTADKNTMVVAMADVFDDQLSGSHAALKGEWGERVQVAPERQFIGFDAYQKLIDSGVDVVILTTPPGFRPAHLQYAVGKGKHIFAEKPVATDAPGVRSVLASVEEAKQKNLCLVAGFCWRYHQPKRATFQQIHEGAIGDIRTIYTTYLTGRVKEDAKWTRQTTKTTMEWMMRRWYFFTWLSGDHLVEQAVHSIDKMSWAMKDQDPIRAIATGGRQVRTDPEYGHIYDHFAVVYDYPGDVKGFHVTRQQDRCAGGVVEQISGTEGVCHMQNQTHSITGKTNWHYEGPQNDMYVTEHEELYAAIRAGKPINDGVRMAKSTLLAIMGRMAAYTGKEISWDEAMNSKEDLAPAQLSWEADIPIPSVAMPGRTPMV
jgi:predicted dehydrogenase